MSVRVVLDINILASASLNPSNIPSMALHASLRSGNTLFASKAMISRLEEILLLTPYFAKRMSPEVADRFVTKIRTCSVDMNPDLTVSEIAPDEEDDRVLGTAVAARADFLVTGDKGLLAIGEHLSVSIVTAREFLAVMAQLEA